MAGSIALLALFACGKVETPNLVDPYANLTGKSLGFDSDPPFFEKDASGNQNGLESATRGACGNVLLQWNPASDAVSGSNIIYYIYQATASGKEDFNNPPTYKTTHFYLTTGSLIPYLVQNLSPATTYYFVVRAADEAGNLSVINLNRLVERSVTTQGTRGSGASPNLYCPGGYAGDTVVLTGTSVAGSTTASFAAFPSPISVPVTQVSNNEVLAIVPANIQTGSIQVNPPGGPGTADSFLFFPPGQNISKNAGFSTEPAIAVSGTTIGMVWTDSYLGTGSGQGVVLFSFSTDSGQTFSAPFALSDPARTSSAPHLSFGPGTPPTVNVVWTDLDTTSNNSDIYFSRSLTGTLTSFSPPVNLSANAGASLHPRVTSSGSSVSVVWDDTSVLYGLSAVWGSTLNFKDVYLAGKGGRIYHSADQGQSWAKQIVNTPSDFNGIWGSGSADIYAAGAGGTIAHFNGSAWSSATVGTSTLNSVWGSGASDVYAVGAGGTIAHFNGSAWSSATVGTSTLNSVWGSGASDVYAVGAGGTIAHFNGSAWSSTTVGTSTLNSVWGSGASDVYAVGAGGTILHWDGIGPWAAQTVNSSDLTAIWGTTYTPSGTINSKEIIYAGTSAGKIIKKDGLLPWDASSVGVGGDLGITGLWGLILSGTNGITANIYGTEGDGPLLQWTGASWTYMHNIDATQGKIFYRLSSDGGLTFGLPTTLSSALALGPQAERPELVQSGLHLTIAWSESLSGIHVIQSSDGGANFSPWVISPFGSSSYPHGQKMTWDGGGYFYMVWEDTSLFPAQISMVKFPVNSLPNFNTSAPLSASGSASEPSVTAVGTRVIAAWVDQVQQKFDNNIPQNEIFLISSPDGGISFTPPVNFSSPFLDASENPSLINNGTGVFMAWQQWVPPTGPLPQNYELFFSHF
jgi:hypothetical protein